MGRSALIRTGLTTLLLAGTWAATGALPSAAAAPAPTGTTAPAAEAPASAGLVSAMRRDLGLTESQATARIAADKKATAIAGKARGAAGSAYGGSWIDAKSGALTVAVADARRAGAVRATGARVELVRYSAGRLNAVKDRIDRLAAGGAVPSGAATDGAASAGASGSATASAPAGVSSWRVDPATNRVVVDVVASHKDDNDVRAFVAQAEKAGPVAVDEVAARPGTKAAGTVGGDPWYTGNIRCSIGFSVNGGFVTAGHCGQPGGSVTGWDGSYIGNIQGSTFPGNDYAWVNVGSGWWTVPVVLGWGTVSDQLVRGSAAAPVGAAICRSGSTSHWHCGNVQATNVTVNYAQGAVYSMTQTSVCVEGGDSGGSYISGDQAQGVTSGGSGDCTSGGQSFFQPINPILSHYGLTLQTSA
ncbi:S1 family peptidase [Streptomyces fuscigenes]|uniref:S1 family peptidase n=1 Tax=Streptomyces fuscigenes TaxID=1528880 RepID=UPI001F205FD5|nr:S1 family peptidase [Streptomyces fuscigenes]MCF3960536.1 S1 family peptidase [Streptomyces fuscigenes]